MWFIIAILLVLWLVGFIALGSAAYWVHILLVAAFILLVVSLLKGRHTTI